MTERQRALALISVLTLVVVAVSVRVPAQPERPPVESRSPRWATVRQKHLEREPACAVCGSLENLEVHHIIPVHMAAELELDEDNLITLCERDHLFFGHLCSTRSWNRDVRKDAEVWRKKIETRP